MTVREYGQKIGEFPEELLDKDISDIEIFLIDDKGDLFAVQKKK